MTKTINETSSYDLFIFAGEQSGDSHGAKVLSSLKQYAPNLSIQGVFGPKMRTLQKNVFLFAEEFQVMGFSDVFKAILRLRKHFHTILNHILATEPKAVLFIDYPGFNLRLAKALRKKGYKGKLIHYICPSVWAWKKNRIKTMEKTLDLLLCIFPFEPEFFKHTALKAVYVGNPSLEEVSKYTYNPSWKDTLGIPKENLIISIFPGSRKNEIARNLPLQFEGAIALKKLHPHMDICISVANEQVASIISPLLKASQERYFLIQEKDRFELMKNSHVAIAKCGTVTLELALHKIPTVVTYQLTKLNAFLAEYVFRINLPFYCIANILLKKELFPELIHKNFTSQNVFLKAQELFSSGTKRAVCIENCERVIQLLNASLLPSDLVAQLLLK